MKMKRRLAAPKKRNRTAMEGLRRLAAQPVTSVRSVERRMVKIYQQYGRRAMKFYAAECIEDLKRERWRLMRDRFEWTDANIERLEAANERLKAALLEMRRQTIWMYEAARERMPEQSISVEGTLWVEEMTFEEWEQDEDMQWALFDVMTSKTYGGFYANSISIPFRLQCNAHVTDMPDTYDTENEVLYLDDKIDNWNELMPRDKTENLHLVYAIHNLYEHCNWAVQDILGIKSYKTKIDVEYEGLFTT